MDKFVPVAIALVTLSLTINVWLSAVSSHVNDQYLDEVFHVGQAQKYCAGKFQDWDPKITTPPGLYLLSYLVHQVSGFCGLTAMRVLNAGLLVCIFFVVSFMGSPSRSRSAVTQHYVFSGISIGSPQQIHTALNVCLFPPLFFFCGLYYTDVGSTLFVLLFFKHFIDIHARGTPEVLQSLSSILLGLTALMFRQTNIFWVAIFPAGFLVIGGIAEKKSMPKDMPATTDTFIAQIRYVVQRSWSDGILYDAQVRGAWFEDYLLATVSIIILTIRALAAPARLLRLVRLVAPYAFLLVLFSVFVFVNGGVVLGDKSNHVATLHLPQMLYIWPYITFFSIPLTYPFIIQGALALVAMTPFTTVFEPLLVFSRHKLLPRLVVILTSITLILFVVRYNTIVHPFTLADNRHYTFYVFRILMRRPTIKYLVTPIYMVCAWSTVQALGAPSNARFVAGEPEQGNMKEKKVLATGKGDIATPSGLEPVGLNNASAGDGCTVSFVLIWLITSTLALVTAPLVEPRYFIIPWVMWRLRVSQACVANQKQKAAADPGGSDIRDAFAKIAWLEHDHRLWLETAWLLAINAVTGWMFLNKGFTWPQEPGNVQRFMW